MLRVQGATAASSDKHLYANYPSNLLATRSIQALQYFLFAPFFQGRPNDIR